MEDSLNSALSWIAIGVSLVASIFAAASQINSAKIACSGDLHRFKVEKLESFLQIFKDRSSDLDNPMEVYESALKTSLAAWNSAFPYLHRPPRTLVTGSVRIKEALHRYQSRLADVHVQLKFGDLRADDKSGATASFQAFLLEQSKLEFDFSQQFSKELEAQIRAEIAASIKRAGG